MKKVIIAALLCALFISVFTLSGCERAENNENEKDNQISDTEGENATGVQSEDKAEADSSVENAELFRNAEKLEKYKTALELLEAGDLYGAYDIFLEIKDFRDVPSYLSCFSFKCSSIVTYSSSSASTAYFEYDEYGKPTLELYFGAPYHSTYAYTFKYDENQNLTESGFYYEGNRYNITLYQYDEKGRPTRQINPDGSYTDLEYDENSNITKRIGSRGNLEEYTYDADGNCLIIEYKEDGDVYLRITNEYDSKGNCIKKYSESAVGKENSIQTVTTIEYDENGRVIKELAEQSNGISWCTQYEYDENGRMIKYRNEHLSGWISLRVQTYKYDENGNLLEEHIEDKDGPNRSIFYELDAKGNCVKQICTMHRLGYTTVETYEYEYDEYGNVIKKISSGETDSAESRVVSTYSDYKLYYNPYPLQELPSQLDGKG